MAASLQDDVNALLTKAQRLRHAAIATAMPDYRVKMLNAARQLEAKASEIEAAPTRVAKAD